MAKYEYTLVNPDDAEATAVKLNENGADGWRLVPGATVGEQLIMERELHATRRPITRVR